MSKWARPLEFEQGGITAVLQFEWPFTVAHYKLFQKLVNEREKPAEDEIVNGVGFRDDPDTENGRQLVIFRLADAGEALNFCTVEIDGAAVTDAETMPYAVARFVASQYADYVNEQLDPKD